MCENNEELFSLKVGETFVCQFSSDRFNELRGLLLEGHTNELTQRRCKGGTTGGPVKEKVVNFLNDGDDPSYAARAQSEVERQAREEKERKAREERLRAEREKRNSLANKEEAPPQDPHCHSFCRYLHCFPNKRQDECRSCEFCNGPHPCDDFCQYQTDPCDAHPANCWGCTSCPGGRNARRLEAKETMRELD